MERIHYFSASEDQIAAISSAQARQAMEEQMQSVQAQPAIRLPFGNSVWRGLKATLNGVATYIAILLRRPRMSGHGVPHYEGRAWCDSMEQQVITDLASCRRPVF